VHTPEKKTVEEVSQFVGVKQEEIVKTLIYKGENRTYAFLIRGCDELNPIKAKRSVEEIDLQPLTEKELKDMGLHSGFLGPIGLKEKYIYVLGDNLIKDMKWCVIGANEKDFHLKGAKIERDFSVDIYTDLRRVKQGESCPVCNGELGVFRGIEIGHIFKLGDKYSKKMNGYFLDEKGKKQYYIMGCYGIGIGRTAQAIVEMHHDERGIIWPLTVAPYDVEIISLTDKDYANFLHDELEKENVEVLLDDRKESPGVKFADCDLIGIPIRIVLGKHLKENKVEISLRKDREKKFLISKHEVVNFVKNLKQKLIKEIKNE
jgi:prolyl-tRNA synthetase